MSEVDNIVDALRSFLPAEQVHPLHQPFFDDRERQLVDECVASGWVSSVGAMVDQFEVDLAKYTGAKYAVATTSGTAALHLICLVSDIGPGDEVLCQSLTFVATANAITYSGAKPHFVDVCPDQLNICPKTLDAYLSEIGEMRPDGLYNKNSNKRIAALMVMHTFGHPADMDGLMAVCSKWNIKLIEDAAESLGSYYKDQHTGTFGDMAAVSFNGNKIITTGGGGAILTDDAEKAKLAKHLSTTAKTPHPYEFVHDHIGYNYRMPNLNAAMGVAQLEKMPRFVEAKRKLAHIYQELFAEIDGVRIIMEPEHSSSNYWLNGLIVDDAGLLEPLLERLIAEKIFVRPSWAPLHKLDIYKDHPSAPLPQTESLSARIINLPSSYYLMDQ